MERRAGELEGTSETYATAPCADASMSAPGAKFGRFVVLGALGRGGMGVVLSALDPLLDRKVAIKFLHGGASARTGPLLQREAQALARLAHPNVVTVYEIGLVDDQAFVAMELVDGMSLRTWLAQARRGWREIVAMFVAAGRGLAAAHAAGLIHRDFKPDNVLIGSDGRPRVSDFGIATRKLDGELEPAAIASLDISTSIGGVPGTPAYMAPEQWTGGETDPRTDEFAFAVALWSALFDERPFDGDTGADLQRQVTAGHYHRPAHAGRAPRWILPLLIRALAPDPDRRWPTLTALLDQLERRAAIRRRTWVAIAGSLAIIGISVGWAVRPVGDPCEPPDARIAPVWGRARRAEVSRHAVVVDPVYGAQRFAAAASALDPGFAAWRQMHVATCRATRVDGSQSDHMLDLRMRCLADWLDASSLVVNRLAAATNSADVEGAVRAISAVPRLERCADARALSATFEPPSRPADRIESDAILSEVKAIAAAARHAGKLVGLAARADDVVTRARRLDHAYTLSRALAVRSRVAAAEQDVTAAVRVLRELVEVAARAHDDEEAARAWSSLLNLVGLFQGHLAEAKVMFLAADAAVVRAGSPPEAVVDTLNYQSNVLIENGEHAAAIAKLDRARRVLEAAGANEPGSPLARYLGAVAQTTGDARHAMGELDAAAASMRESLAIYTRIYGPDTLESANVYLDLAQVLRDLGQLADGELAARAGVRIRTRGGQTPGLALALSTLSDIVSRRGRSAEAIALGERAVELARATMPPTDATLLVLRENLADAYDTGGEPARALAMYDDILATFDREDVTNLNVITGLLNRAGIARRLGRCDEAIRDDREATKRAIQLEGEAGREVGVGLRGEGLCLDRLGHTRQAIDVLERGLAIEAPGAQADEAELARGALGRLLVVTGRDPARGKALVKSALARLHEIGSTDPVVTMLDAWLAKQRP